MKHPKQHLEAAVKRGLEMFKKTEHLTNLAESEGPMLMDGRVYDSLLKLG